MKKKYLIFGVLVVFALIACKTVEVNVKKQSNDGELIYSYIDIDPIVVANTWEKVNHIAYNVFMAELYFRNPDEESPFQFATIFAIPAGCPMYSYMINGEINVCEYNEDEQGYISVWDTFSDEVKAKWYEDYSIYFGISGS